MCCLYLDELMSNTIVGITRQQILRRFLCTLCTTWRHLCYSFRSIITFCFIFVYLVFYKSDPGCYGIQPGYKKTYLYQNRPYIFHLILLKYQD